MRATLGVSWSALVSAACVLNSPSGADDWPQWMGPQRDGQWRETGILDEFPKNGPKILWRTPIAGGYAGPAVAGGLVFVADYVRQDGDPANDPGKRSELTGRERVLCFDASAGVLVWKHEYDRPYAVSYPAGPRATPTVDGDRVYALGAEGNLWCLKTDSGEVVWSKDLQKEYGVETPIWGFCAHPLVDGDKLVCLVGGEGSVAVAFDKRTGREIWRSLTASEPGYSPPSIVEAGGVRQLIVWHPEAVNGLNPETGEVYWSIPLRPNYGMSIMAPRAYGDLLFASGIGGAAAVMRLDRAKPAAEVVWRGKRDNGVYCANSTPIIDRGIVYGVDCDKGSLRAVKLEDGEILWETWEPTTESKRRAGHGTAFLVKNGEKYFLFSETGELILARLSPEKYEEVGRARLLAPTGEAFGREVVWSHPAFAHQCVFARNDKELVCASLAKE